MLPSWAVVAFSLHVQVTIAPHSAFPGLLVLALGFVMQYEVLQYVMLMVLGPGSCPGFECQLCPLTSLSHSFPVSKMEMMMKLTLFYLVICW